MKYKHFLQSAVAAAAFVVVGAAQAGTVNLLTNGSFENPSVANGSYIFTDTLPGWAIEGDTNVEIRNGVAGNAYDGKNYVELDSDKGNMSIWQDIATEIGKTYQITFAYAPREGRTALDNPIAVSWGDAPTSDTDPWYGTPLPGSPFTGDGGASGNNWVLYTFNVVANSTLSRLKFGAVGDSTTYGGGIDAVSVSAVPLPGAALLFGSALLGAGALRRKKNSESADAALAA